MSDYASISDLIATAERFAHTYRELAELHRHAAQQAYKRDVLWTKHVEHVRQCEHTSGEWQSTANLLRE